MVTVSLNINVNLFLNCICNGSIERWLEEIVFFPSALSQDDQDDAQLKIEDILQMVRIVYSISIYL